MSYEVITPTDLSSANRTFEILQPDFKKIGVQLTQKALDSSAAFDAMTAPDGKYANFDLALWDWTGLIDPDFMLSVVTCDQWAAGATPGFCNKKYDAMYSKQQLTPDQAKRRDVVWQMQKYLQARRSRTSGSPHSTHVGRRVDEVDRISSTRRRGRSTRSRS